MGEFLTPSLRFIFNRETVLNHIVANNSFGFALPPLEQGESRPVDNTAPDARQPGREKADATKRGLFELVGFLFSHRLTTGNDEGKTSVSRRFWDCRVSRWRNGSDGGRAVLMGDPENSRGKTICRSDAFFCTRDSALARVSRRKTRDHLLVRQRPWFHGGRIFLRNLQSGRAMGNARRSAGAFRPWAADGRSNHAPGNGAAAGGHRCPWRGE